MADIEQTQADRTAHALSNLAAAGIETLLTPVGDGAVRISISSQRYGEIMGQEVPSDDALAISRTIVILHNLWAAALRADLESQLARAQTI